MSDDLLRYTLRINRELFAKFRFVAKYNGRSANREIEQQMKQVVSDFEASHEKIEINDK